MPFHLPALPYAPDALAPHISATTMSLHHGKHHQAYVNVTNELVAGSPLESQDLVTVVRSAARDGNTKLHNQSGQIWNHSFFWQCMKGGGGGAPTGAIAERISAELGGYEKFVASFKAACLGQFGSGWGWLVLDGDALKITSLANGDSPVAYDTMRPLLGLDVWEHAYYLDYQNVRASYVDAFIANLIDWDFVNANLDGQGSSRGNQR